MSGRRGPRGETAFVSLSSFSRAPVPRGGTRTEAGIAGTTQTKHAVAGSKGAAISNMVVRTMSEYTGRGPTKARTYLHEDVVIVVLHDTLTKGERSLVSEGLLETVLSTRKAFQGTMRHDLISGIEQILGRTVEAFFSDNHIDPDVAAEVFLLMPRDAGPQGDGSHRAAKTPSGWIAGAHP